MDSLSHDENDNHVPIAHSTPTASKKPKLQCPHCPRQYTVNHYFKLHVQSHNPQPDPSNPVIDDEAPLSQSNVSADESLSCNVSILNNSTQPEPSTFKKPKKPAPKPKPKYVCTYCLKGYLSLSYFKNHVRLHVVQDTASRMPNIHDILESTKEISLAALKVASNGPVAEATGGQYRSLLGEVWERSTTDSWTEFSSKVCKEMVLCIEKQKFILPSALATSLTEKADGILSDIVLCDEFLSALKLSLYEPENLPFHFLIEFVLALIPEILGFISKALHAIRVPTVAVQVHQEIDEECRQVIYYMAGSIIRGYFRIAYRYKSSHTWAEIVEVLKAKVLCAEPILSVDSAWTKAVDRGGLLHPNEKCQEFFVVVTSIVFLHEGRDGSIDFEAVVSKVLDSNASAIWDMLISDSLPEAVSLNLLTDIVHCYCRACGRGFAKRRLNEIREKAMASMPTRHLVASRKK